MLQVLRQWLFTRTMGVMIPFEIVSEGIEETGVQNQRIQFVLQISLLTLFIQTLIFSKP